MTARSLSQQWTNCCSRAVPEPKRLELLFTDYPVYFLTACTYNRRRILDRPAIHEPFIQFGLRATERGI